jgi:hypothetical protein
MRAGGLLRSMVPILPSLVANKIVPILTSTAAGSTSALATSLPEVAHSSTPILLRGGQVTVDLARTQLRLDSLNSYAIITALLMSAALNLYSSTPKHIEGGGRSKENIATKIFVISAGLSIICGAYTTVVFSLLSLYSKTALGLGQDARFLEFFAATTISRRRAFHSFLMALLSFEVCFVASLFLNYNGKVRWSVLVLATAAAILSWCHWQTVINIAGKLLFT